MRYDLVALGELLIDFTQSGVSKDGMRLFEQNPGGAVANMLAAAAKLDHATALIAKVGDDMHGQFLIDTLCDAKIDTSCVVQTNEAFTTLAFVALSPDGERTFSFARKPGADTCLRLDEVDVSMLRDTKVFHIGSLSLTDQPARSATLHALGVAKEAGAIISYDPNYRASLWQSRGAAQEQMRVPLAQVDVIKLSDEETELLTDKTQAEDAAQVLYRRGIPLAAITLGKDGALVCAQGKTMYVSGYKVPVTDTTGAGDAFWGGFLHCLLVSRKHPREVTLSEAADFASFGNACAALCIQRRGAIPAMPSPEEIDRLRSGNGIDCPV